MPHSISRCCPARARPAAAFAHPRAERTLARVWRTAPLVGSGTVTEAAPGASIIPTASQQPGTFELRELSLALRRPSALRLLVRRSHPAIDTIVEASTRVADHGYL